MVTGSSLLFLLGAGASVDAGVKDAKGMTADVEEKIRLGQLGQDFEEFNDLYNYLKSSIIYQRGLEGEFKDQTVTIEELLVVLSEINQKHQNKLYPFIGGWNVHLLKVAGGEEFEKAANLDKKIREELVNLINIKKYNEAGYFQGFRDLRNGIDSAFRVFTLNYDICVEKALAGTGFNIELGFNSDGKWEATRFDANKNADVDMYLYKLHGSIDWKRDKENGNILKLYDDPQPDAELIFGTESKLSPIDPYLFYFHEFRKYSLNKALKLIVVIGYSFSDDHVNALIGQAVTRNEHLKVLVVAPALKDKDKADIKESLGIKNILSERIKYKDKKAKLFFEEEMKPSDFNKLLG